jgi:thiamine pyrophosphate-dependent acetolactate synthase large subunit-like protein
MGTATGAQLLVRMLKAEGVKHVFTLSGLHIAPIYAACIDEGIQIIDTRHEQAAAHAADATARLTRGIGVVAVTAGPGVTDALTGIANAWAASSPVLLLGGAGRSLHPHHQVERSHSFARSRAHVYGARVPADADGAARAGVSRAALGRALQRGG